MGLLLSFDEWQDCMLEETTPDTVVLCPECDGGGMVYEECPCCEHESEKSCALCREDGRVKFKHLSDSEKKQVFSKKEYLARVDKDTTKWQQFTGRGRMGMLLDAGISSYCRTSDQSEVVFYN